MNPELQEKQMELTGPGRRLMEARNALNLSRDDVAQQLKLKMNTVIAIEEDRIEELPAPMYVIGYLRNYAKLLKIPHEPIVNSFEQLQIEPPPIINEVVKPQNKGNSAKLVKWGSIAISLVLLAGFVSWLVSQDFDFIGQMPVSGEKETVVSDIVPDNQQVVETEKQEVIELLPTESSQQPVALADQTSEEVTDTEAPSFLVTDKSKIVLTLTDDCWVEIIDSSGNKVIYNLLTIGKPYTFYASPPFSVFLGNAEAVSMSINDKSYDISQHIRGELARFEIADSRYPARQHATQFYNQNVYHLPTGFRPVGGFHQMPPLPPLLARRHGQYLHPQ